MRKYALLIAIALIAILAFLPSNEQQLATDFESMTIETPSSIRVDPSGTEVDGSIDGVSPDSLVTLWVETSTGDVRQDLNATDDSVTFRVELPEPSAGTVRLVAVSDGKAATATVEVEPLTAETPVDLYTGQRTVVVGGQQTTMAAAVPADELGNPVKNGSRVSFDVTRPDDEIETFDEVTQSLLAWILIPSKELAGRTAIRTEAGQAIGPRDTVIEVPANPVEVLIVEEPIPLPTADGFTYWRVATEPMFDRFENGLLDGQAATLIVNGPTGTSRHMVPVISGQAIFNIPAPALPGTYEAVVTVNTVSSEPTSYDFATAINSFDARWASETEILTIGPIQTIENDLVADGTTAFVTEDDGSITEIDLLAGIAELQLDGEPQSVSVLGVTEEVSRG